MFIVTYGNECGSGNTIEEAVNNSENNGYTYDPDDTEYTFYEAKEIKVQRKFEVIKED